MIQNMRDKTQGVIALGIAILIALTFALWGVQNYLSTGANRPVAKVNGEDITQQQLHSAYEQTKRMAMVKNKKHFVLDQKGQAELRKDVLQHLIKQEVILQSAKKIGLEIGKNQLWSIIIGMPAFQVDGQFSLSRFRQVISNFFASEQAFFDDLQSSIVQSQLEKSIANSAFLLPKESGLIKKIFKQRRDFGYFLISPDRFKKDVSVTSDDIKKYYDDNQSEFIIPEKISIQYLELNSDDLRSKIKPTEDQLKYFYKTHLEFFSTPKKWHMTRVLVPLSSDADERSVKEAKEEIDKVVAQLVAKKEPKSDNKKVQINTSWVKRVGLTPEVGAQLEKLETDQISAPFRTQEGFNLIKVLAIEQGKATPYDDAKNDVKRVYTKQKLAQLFLDASDKLADLAYINSDSLKPAAKDLGLKLKETEMFSRKSPKNGILLNQKIVNSAFSDTILKQGYNSGLIEISSGKVVVLRIKDHMPESIKPLDKVKDLILNKLQAKEAKNRAKNLADTILKDLSSDKSDKEVAKKYDLTWHTMKNSKYGESKVSTGLVNAAFALFKSKSNNGSLSVIDVDGDFAVLRLDKVYNAAASNEDERVNHVLKFYPNMIGRFDYNLLMENLMDKAKIKIIDEN